MDEPTFRQTLMWRQLTSYAADSGMPEQSSLSEPETVTQVTKTSRPAPLRGVRGGSGTGGQRAERLTAEMTAFREARVVLASMPMPHRTLPSMAHSMYEAACAEAPSLMVCSW